MIVFTVEFTEKAPENAASSSAPVPRILRLRVWSLAAYTLPIGLDAGRRYLIDKMTPIHSTLLGEEMWQIVRITEVTSAFRIRPTGMFLQLGRF
jgi:hypothetical protein